VRFSPEARRACPTASKRLPLAAAVAWRRPLCCTPNDLLPGRGHPHMKGRSSLLPASAESTYPAGLFARSTLGHCDRRALTVSSRWMTAPSVITPRSANKLERAKQLNGIASASNKSRFMAKCVCLWLRRPTEF
jgi:hypothetical protein